MHEANRPAALRGVVMLRREPPSSFSNPELMFFRLVDCFPHGSG